MRATTTTTARKASTTAPAPAPAPVAATTAPHGTTTTTVVGTPVAQVPHLAYLATLPVPVALAQPTAPWPGWGKAVRVAGTGWQGTAYANRGNVTLRATVAVAASLAAQVPGAQVRGNGTYVLLPYSATGTPQA